MPKFMDWLNPASKKNPFRKFAEPFYTGSPEEHKQISTLLPNQQGLQEQQVNAAMNPGAGGAFGQSADYHRNMLSDNSADIEAFNAPQIRQFNEDIIPGLSEQFAGMGAGGLSSSGFRNAATSAGTDLAERLGAIRANLRQNSANSLQGIGQAGLNQYSQDRMTQPGSQGMLSQLAPAVGTAVGAYFGGPQGAAIGNMTGNAFSGNSRGNRLGDNTGVYQSGNTISASPQLKPSQSLPNFQFNNRGY